MHDYYAMPNACQSPEERRMKYAFARLAGLSKLEADRVRDWNWSKLQGCLATAMALAGKPKDDVEAIKELCQNGYEIFLGEAKAYRSRKNGG